MSAYHRISKAVQQAPAEYMGGGETHITDYDPESGQYGEARYERRRGEGPPPEEADRWVEAFNSGVPVLDIARESGYPYLTVQNEIAKHPAKSRGSKSSVLTSVQLTGDLTDRIDRARGDEAASRFVIRLLEKEFSGWDRAKAAAREPDEAEVDRWVRMRQRGLNNSQIAEAVGRYPREVSRAVRERLDAKPRRRTKGTPAKLTLRMPTWLKRMLDNAAEVAETSRNKLMRQILDRALPA